MGWDRLKTKGKFDNSEVSGFGADYSGVISQNGKYVIIIKSKKRDTQEGIKKEKKRKKKSLQNQSVQDLKIQITKEQHLQNSS